MRLHHYHHYPWDVAPQWAEDIQESLNLLNQKVEILMSELDDLTAQVAANKTVSQSALALISGIAARITAAGTDPAKLAELTASLKSDDEALAAAITANTPPTP